MKSRGRRAFVWCATGVTTAALGALDASCRDPTEVTVSISTTQPCGKFQGVAITVGPDVTTTETNFDNHFVNATSTTCDAATGLVGTLVLTPGNTTGTVLVAGGVQKPDGTFQDPSECGGGTEVPGEGGVLTDPNSAYCIIARRTFAFAEHTPLTLPIKLETSCIGRDCNPGSTCFQGGCVSDNVVCSGSACGLTQEIDQGSGSGDGSISSSSDGSYDASFDTGIYVDSGVSSFDAGPDASGAPICSAPSFVSSSVYQAGCDLGNGTGVACDSTSNGYEFCCTCACIVDGGPDHYVSCNATSATGACSGSCEFNYVPAHDAGAGTDAGDHSG